MVSDGGCGLARSIYREYTGQYQCLRLYGRYPDRSFTLSGDCVSLVELENILLLEKWGYWSVDLDHVGSREESAEVRVVMNDGAPREEVLHELRAVLMPVPGGAGFMVRVVEYDGLE